MTAAALGWPLLVVGVAFFAYGLVLGWRLVHHAPSEDAEDEGSPGPLDSRPTRDDRPVRLRCFVGSAAPVEFNNDVALHAGDRITFYLTASLDDGQGTTAQITVPVTVELLKVDDE